jgi:branched-chain amino acid transport system ATP-binding protein
LALLEIQELSKSFGGIQAVDRCSFAVEAGSITALIGPNGAGKTTVFNLISGLHKPDAGAILFDGARIDDLPPHRITRKGIARTFQISRDLAGLSALENVIVQSRAGGLLHLLQPSMSPAERDRAMDLLGFVGIADLASEPAAKLSYGQKKLMELAACLMLEPRLVLLDEPAGGINPALLEVIIDRVQRLRAQGMTFLIVEHNMDVVMDMCDPVIVMAYGRFLAQGSPAAIQNDEAVLEAYLGAA